MSIFQNTCKPKGFGGKIMCKLMNKGHSKLSKWGFQFLAVDRYDYCLDLGCGGGANVKKLVKLTEYGHVTGLDYSEVSVELTKKKNKKACDQMHAYIVQGDVMDLPFKNNVFNVATAFETIYFWPDIRKAFKNVYDVLKSGGTFLICNETDGLNPKDNKRTEKIEGMRVYTADELKENLLKAGFNDVIIYHDEKTHYLALVATKY